MKRMAATIICLAVCAAMAGPVLRSASACQVDEFYHTKEGALAASTPQTVNAAIKLEEQGKQEELEALVKSGAVVRLAENIKVRVLERSVEFKTLQIKLPDGRDPYWVKDGSLKTIDCK